MAYLELRDVTKSHGCGDQRTSVLRNFRLEVAEGECVALVGEPGCGKSTLLSLVAGLTMPDFGSITLAGRPVVGPGPDRLFLSQNCALLPWLSVLENLVVSVEGMHPTWSKEAVRRQAEKVIDGAGLTSLARKKPRELTPAARKRVSLARTLAMNPDLLLLDDPFTGLDASTRSALQSETARALASEKKTCLLATEDLNEALLLADRVVVMGANAKISAADPVVVDLPRPRDRRSPDAQRRFNELRKSLTILMRALRDETPIAVPEAGEPRSPDDTEILDIISPPIASTPAPHFERVDYREAVR